MRITHAGIRISKSSDIGEADCPTTSTISPQPLLEKGMQAGVEGSLWGRMTQQGQGFEFGQGEGWGGGVGVGNEGITTGCGPEDKGCRS